MALIINGESIDDLLIEREAEALRPSYEQFFANMAPVERESQLKEWAKENVIEKVLLRQHAKGYGGKLSESEMAAAMEEMSKTGALDERVVEQEKNQYRENIELQMRVDKLLHDLCKDLPEPNREEIEQYYENNKEQFKVPEQIRVSHIVKHINWQCDSAQAEQSIRQAKAELNDGAVFEAVAEKYSDCPDNGGDIGYIVRGQMVEEFEDVVFNLDAGQVSDIFQTRFGFHIATVYDRKHAHISELEKVNQRIIESLKRQSQQQRIEEFVDELKAQAEIREV